MPSHKQEKHGLGVRPNLGSRGILGAILICLSIVVLAGLLLPALANLEMRKAHKHRVVVYAAQDQVYAEPILQEFGQETGIQVKAVYDSEAVKTVGLANRLLAERAHPVCDIFWGNEELRTRQLAAQGVFRETNGWAAMGYRSRRMVVNTHFVASLDLGHSALPNDQEPMTKNVLPAPPSLLELTNARWRGKIALAYPLFGTTATHFLALRQHWGEALWERWCRALAANEALVVDGNSVVVNLVGRGEAWIGLTDSDDIIAGQRAGLPVAALPLNEESLLIPNTVAVIRTAPHPEMATRLFDALQSDAVVDQLVASGALEGADRRSVATRTLEPDWEQLLADLETGTGRLKEIFLRQTRR